MPTARDGRRSQQSRQRRQFDAELRVNVVRLAAVATFYGIHLLQYYAAADAGGWWSFLGLGGGPTLSQPLHLAVTSLVLAWIAAAMIVHQLLEARILPAWLMYASTALDACLLTCVLSLASGAASPVVAGYFLIVIMAGLRFDLRLVRCATACVVIGYVVLLGAARWSISLSAHPLPIVPRYQQLVTIAALLLAGILVGQGVRSLNSLLSDDERPDDPESQT